MHPKVTRSETRGLALDRYIEKIQEGNISGSKTLAMGHSSKNIATYNAQDGSLIPTIVSYGQGLNLKHLQKSASVSEEIIKSPDAKGPEVFATRKNNWLKEAISDGLI